MVRIQSPRPFLGVWCSDNTSAFGVDVLSSILSAPAMGARCNWSAWRSYKPQERVRFPRPLPFSLGSSIGGADGSYPDGCGFESHLSDHLSSCSEAWLSRRSGGPVIVPKCRRVPSAVRPRSQRTSTGRERGGRCGASSAWLSLTRGDGLSERTRTTPRSKRECRL